MSKYSKHQTFLKEVKLEIQKEFPTARVFDQDSGLYVTQQGQYIRIGVDGMADLRVLYPSPIGPISIEVEIKTNTASQNKAQKDWEVFWNSMRGIYIVVSNKSPIVPQLKKIKNLVELIESINWSQYGL